MGTYYDAIVTISGNDINELNTKVVNYLNNIEGISAELYDDIVDSDIYNGVIIRFNNTNIEVFLGRSPNSELYKYVRKWIKNGDVLICGPYTGSKETAPLRCCYLKVYENNNFISVNMCYAESSASQYMLGSCHPTLITMDNGDKLVGYYNGSSKANIMDISSLSFENINDPARVKYEYTNMFPYTANSGTLDFLAQAYFTNNGVRRYTTKLLKECSTVNLLSTVSLPDPLGNHLAIGEHCIVPITVEGGNS